ncbi:Gfo/Idh/MocA family protein [Haloarchaeobius sp. HME9146]|uniref:Gfo/Idh/MocA family protein n=1 Tax=Haloarchaeobius sp. HME9146 TaxID=2978732 RepID=UPI0021C23288|nr:Gfo/Idh/MocA family oxidoreductase [Haloarchaeobius sp. HME9146]MCT9097971.1 Gfo/Idh/MocA family oxidoreductase [Haloarchaeobius sp. HME9146]
MTDDDTIRIGIVGLGGIARHHADHLEALTNDDDIAADLAGGMDIVADARDAFEADYGVPTYEDAAELYETVDAVIVTTPNRFHEEYVTSALEAGLDVLVEKPLAHSVESAERIAAVARDADSFCMVGFHNRFAPTVEVLKEQQDQGRFGDVYHVEANYIRRRGVPGRGSWFTDSSVAGGGSLIDIGAHAIDLAMHMLDFPEVVEVSGETRSIFGGREDYTYLHMWGKDGDGDFDVDDSAQALVRFANGQTLALETSWATNRPPTQTYVMQGTEAGATVDRADETLTIHEVEDIGGPHFSDTEITTREEPAHRKEQRAFVEAVAAGEAPERNTVEQALTVQRIMGAIYESSERGEAVSLRDDHDTEPPLQPPN